MRSALRNGQVLILGADDGDVEHVHVQDLADLYLNMASRVAKDQFDGMPSGERGIYFAGTGRHTWIEFAQGIANALYNVGGSKTKEIRRVGLEDAAAEWTGGDEVLCELNFGSKYVATFPRVFLYFDSFRRSSLIFGIKQFYKERCQLT